MQFAADNSDLNEETIDNKNTTHAITVVVNQKKAFGPELTLTIAGDHSQRRRSLKGGGIVYELQKCSDQGRRPSLSQYTSAVNKEWLKNEGGVLTEAISTDDTWNLLRMKPESLETAITTQEVQSVRSWGDSTRSCIPTFLLQAKLDTVP